MPGMQKIATTLLIGVFIADCYSLKTEIVESNPREIGREKIETVEERHCSFQASGEADRLQLEVKMVEKIRIDEEISERVDRTNVKTFGEVLPFWQGPQGFLLIVLWPLTLPVDLIRAQDETLESGIRKRTVHGSDETRTLRPTGRMELVSDAGTALVQISDGKGSIRPEQISAEQLDVKINGNDCGPAYTKDWLFQHRLAIWKQDSKTLLGLIAPALQFKPDYKDTDLEATRKKQGLEKAMLAINQEHLGQTLKIKRVRVVDIRPEKELNAYGKQRARKIIQELRSSGQTALFAAGGDIENNPLLAFYVILQMGFCDKCYSETGRFEGLYEIPIPTNSYDQEKYESYRDGVYISDGEISGFNTMDVGLSKVVGNEASVRDLKKGEIVTFEGKIQGIEFDGTRVHIKLK